MRPEESVLRVRRSVFVNAGPSAVWRAFETKAAMEAWWGYLGGDPVAGTGGGQRLHTYEPHVGADIDMSVDFDGRPVHFGGRIVAFEPGRHLIYENNWRPASDWTAHAFIALCLTGAAGGTLVELFHYGFERTGGDVAATHASYEQGWGMTQLLALKRVVEAAA